MLSAAEELEQSKARALELGLGWPAEVREHEREGMTYHPVARLMENIPVTLYAAACTGMTEHLERIGYRAVFLREYGMGVVWAYRDPQLVVEEDE